MSMICFYAIHKNKHFFNKFYFIFFFFCLPWVCTAAVGFSLVAASKGCSLAAVLRLLILVASLIAERRFYVHGL